MTEHLSNQEIEQYRRGLAAAPELLALDEHLAACAACRARAAAMSGTESGLAALVADYRAAAAEPEHLEYEALATYVDGGLDEVDKEIVRTHLAVCPECALEERDLRDYKSSVVPGLHKAYEPAAVRPSGASRWRWLSERWQAYRASSPAWQMSVAGALLLLAGISVWLIWNARRQVAPPQIVKDRADEIPKKSDPTPTNAGDQTSQALVALNDGARRVMLYQDGRLSGLDGLSASAQTAVKTALQRQAAVNRAALAGLGSNDGALMSGQPKPGEFDILEPRGQVVASDRPTFRWRALEGASSYTVKVFDQDFNLVTESPALNTNAWRAGKPLARGAVYAWQVTALKNGEEVKAPRPPAPQARFKVLDGGAAAELQMAQRQEPASHLTLGVLYARNGMLDEAERELRTLLQANPQSEVAQKLLAEVQTARRARRGRSRPGCPLRRAPNDRGRTARPDRGSSVSNAARYRPPAGRPAAPGC